MAAMMKETIAASSPQARIRGQSKALATGLNRRKHEQERDESARSRDNAHAAGLYGGLAGLFGVKLLRSSSTRLSEPSPR
jgi:hypothetical protein